ncbi:hypothetical protein FRC06_001852 [Ceratobasidium sp. 370]|nr:hypothetical protein FRC06_001852 [Ceratobasidium sp. 370]
MVHHWKGTFKWINNDDEVYHLNCDTWKLIGNLTTQATHTIPSQFAGTLPNIDTDMGLYKAEAYSFWFTYLAPILLNGRLNQEHYVHFLEMREIIVWCLQFEITDAQVDALEEKINQWVQDYKSMPELLRTPTNLTLQAGKLIPLKEKIYDFRYVLGQPVRRMHHTPNTLKRQMTKYFGVAEGPPHRQGPRPTWQELLNKIDWDMLYELLPDGNADRPNERDRAIRRIYYGRVHDIFYVEFIQDPATNTQIPYLLVRVKECNTHGLDATDPENPIVTYNRLDTPDIINLGTVHAAIGRIKIGGRNTWGIVDRS